MLDSTSTLYDHYKETCSNINDTIKRRDRALLWVVLTLFFFAFQALFPSVSNQIVQSLLMSKYGLNLELNFSIIGNIVWFLLLVFTLRYFQSAIFIERQYKYVHKIEDKMNNKFGEDLITREGKSYLSDYPAFSNWTWFIYVLAFPTLLTISAIAKIIMEWVNAYQKINFGLILDTILFLLLLTSIILYLYSLFTKKDREDIKK